MTGRVIVYTAPIINKNAKTCLSNRYGQSCKRKVRTGFCWQHYPQIRPYNDPTSIQTCVCKLMRLCRSALRLPTQDHALGIVHALFEVTSINKWYLRLNEEFRGRVVQKYFALREQCELARYSFLEKDVNEWQHLSVCSNYRWLFPTVRYIDRTNSCYASSN